MHLLTSYHVPINNKITSLQITTNNSIFIILRPFLYLNESIYQCYVIFSSCECTPSTVSICPVCKKAYKIVKLKKVRHVSTPALNL